MPGRRWRGRHGDGPMGGVCPRRIVRFIEPCLLLLLREGASHGYDLAEALARFGFAPGTVDFSVVYRALREMEKEGWVTSQWDISGPGLPRRVYRITPEGEDHLRGWMADLRRTHEEIGRFLEFYEQQEEQSHDKGGAEPQRR